MFQLDSGSFPISSHLKKRGAPGSRWSPTISILEHCQIPCAVLCAESFLSFWAKNATPKEFILSTIWPVYTMCTQDHNQKIYFYRIQRFPKCIPCGFKFVFTCFHLGVCFFLPFGSATRKVYNAICYDFNFTPDGAWFNAMCVQTAGLKRNNMADLQGEFCEREIIW